MFFPALHTITAAPLSQCIGIPRRFPHQTRYLNPPKSSPILIPRSSFLPFDSTPISNLHISKCRFEDDFSVLPPIANSIADDDCFSNPETDVDALDSNHPTSSMPTTNALFRNMGWVGVGTITSKISGVLREIVLAAIFGVGPVANAFSHASLIPRFFTSHLGGVNGPIHITMATALSKHQKESRRHLIRNASCVLFLVGGILGAIVYIFAESIINISAPGLWSLADGQMTREVAIIQDLETWKKIVGHERGGLYLFNPKSVLLSSFRHPSKLKVMTPCIVFAGPVGLGFGSFSAEGDNIVPCLSPAVSNIAIISLCAIYVFMGGSNTSHSRHAPYGGLLLPCGASLGVFLQWLIQVLRNKTGFEFISCSWKKIVKDKDLHKFFALMLPATLSSGMIQVVSCTDLYFASFIPGAAAAISYAHLLAMAPLGIVLSTIILPLIPTFSRLEKPPAWPYLKENLQQAFLLCVAIVLPIALSVSVLAEQIISILFQRFAFDSAARTLVSSLLLCYSIGTPFYVIRELLVVIYYAHGDGKPPFFISVAAILLNGFLDWIFTSQFNLGAQGLVLSTASVTALSTLVLFYMLLKKLPGLIDFPALLGPLLLLLGSSIISGFTTFICHKMLQHLLSPVAVLRFCQLSQLLPVLLASFLGTFAFFYPLLIFQFSGMKLVKNLLETLLNRLKFSKH